MILTDKCKEDFEAWFETYFKADYVDDLNMFLVEPDSMKYGVIQDFADSVRYYKTTIQRVNGGFQLYDGSYFKSRPEARTEAVEQFNKLYNDAK